VVDALLEWGLEILQPLTQAWVGSDMGPSSPSHTMIGVLTEEGAFGALLGSDLWRNNPPPRLAAGLATGRGCFG
jgi:hypothetical protein